MSDRPRRRREAPRHLGLEVREVLDGQLLLGVGENAAPTLLTELDPKDVPRDAAAKVSFLDVLRQKGATPPPKPDAEVHDDEKGAA